jgi:hypothetical protein
MIGFNRAVTRLMMDPNGELQHDKLGSFAGGGEILR